jgi:hypothetical protein
MMKLLTLAVCLLHPLNTWANDNFLCTNNNIQLSISISAEKSVAWTLKLIDEDDKSSITGSGVWQKEADSADAFSSFDDNSAISYKNNRAVFVMSSNQALFFPVCEKL